jgi:hypothetical protein
MTRLYGIEPYTLRLTIEGRVSDPEGIIAALVTDVAERCQDAGGPLIGHIKCHASTAAGNFHCGLTSLPIGAQCSSLPLAAELPLGRVDVNLAILVYGLELETIDSITRASVNALRRTARVTCEVLSSSAAHNHPDPACS